MSEVGFVPAGGTRPQAGLPLLFPSLPQFLDESLPAVEHWTSQQVGQWLHSLNLEQYAAEFAARQVDGPQLLQLDGSKLKVGQSAELMVGQSEIALKDRDCPSDPDLPPGLTWDFLSLSSL